MEKSVTLVAAVILGILVTGCGSTGTIYTFKLIGGSSGDELYGYPKFHGFEGSLKIHMNGI